MNRWSRQPYTPVADARPPKYRVLVPRYERTGEVERTPDGEVKWCRVAEWIELGTAVDMADALRKFPRSYWTTYSPVLEAIGEVH